MLFHCIDNFYEPNNLGLLTLCFMNDHFSQTHQSKDVYYGGDRLKAYPCYESIGYTLKNYNEKNPLNPTNFFVDTFEKKTNLKILRMLSFFRKIKLSELKNSSNWKQFRPHTDNTDHDFAGVIYFNSNSLKDGTYFYNSKFDLEPTAIIGSKLNRCVFYNTQTPHSIPADQEVEERWIQAFFITTKEETLKKHKETDAA